MRKYIITTIILTMTVFMLAGCSNGNDKISTVPNTEISNNSTPNQSDEAPASTEQATLEKISAEEAKEMIDSSTNLIILDVRTQEEYEDGHIEGAALIPDYEIETKAEELLTDKNATILVYCRSGRRSALAANTLRDQGYTSIYDFGGILDWPYEVTKQGNSDS